MGCVGQVDNWLVVVFTALSCEQFLGKKNNKTNKNSPWGFQGRNSGCRVVSRFTMTSLPH
jgi:hypothetical protein